ncbi:MAG: hypothetical protein U0930_18265 [Pirellulales bacterium]
MKTLNDANIELLPFNDAMHSKGTIRELLRRSLEPYKLTYLVHESYVEITTMEFATLNPVARYYNLSFVLPDNKLQVDVIQAIESSVDPDCWANAGGDSTIFSIGPVLVVRTIEVNHLEVEQLLSQLSQHLVPDNDRQLPVTQPNGIKN